MHTNENFKEKKKYFAIKLHIFRSYSFKILNSNSTGDTSQEKT